MRLRTIVTVTALLASPSSALAQQNPSRWAVAAGVVWTGGYAAGGSTATETSNPSVSANPLKLFTVTGHGDAVAGLVGRLGFRVADGITLEAEGQFSRPVLRAALAQDFESAAPATATERFNDVVFGGSVVWRAGVRGRLVPFLSGGAAYVRRMTVESTESETSSELHAGGGVEFALTRRLALRADARVASLSHPLGFNTPRKYLPQVIGTLAFSH